MKVIDLLNKIANGENPPKKIKINDNYYEYSGNAKNIYSYKEMDKKNKHCLENGVSLNTEVEVIEEDKKIEKIICLNNVSNASDLTALSQMQWENNSLIERKINEIIDILNKE